MCEIQLVPLEILSLREECRVLPKGGKLDVDTRSDLWHWLDKHYPPEDWHEVYLNRCGVRLFNRERGVGRPNFTLRWKRLLEEAANCGEEVS